MKSHLRKVRRRHRPWSELLPEILELILQRLQAFQDYLKFGQVCTSWRSVLHTGYGRPRSPPCMMVSTITNPIPPLLFMGLHGGKAQELRSPVPTIIRTKRIVGSSMGWLVIVSSFNIVSGFHLLNPISNKRIALPSNLTGGIPMQFWGGKTAFAVRDVKLSSPPTSGNCVLVARGHQKGHNVMSELAWCRLCNHREWNVLPGYQWQTVKTMEFHKGKLYVLSYKGYIHVYTFDPEPRMTRVIAADPAILPKYVKRLVVSGKKLLVVVRHRRAGTELYNPVRRTDRWERVESLGDLVLLIGDHGAESFSTRDYGATGFEANCIYYHSWRDEQALEKFSIAEMSTETIPIHLARPSKFELDWIVPQTC